MKHASESGMHCCPHCGAQVKSHERHSCGAPAEKLRGHSTRDRSGAARVALATTVIALCVAWATHALMRRTTPGLGDNP